MKPVIGITCSTLTLSDMKGVRRLALPQDYVDCVVRAGGLPLVLPNLSAEIAAEYVEVVDGLLLSGGGDVDPCFFGEEPRPGLGRTDAARDGFEIELTRAACTADLPILAVCRGIQVLNVAFGGTLIQHVPAQVEDAVKHAQETVRLNALAHSVTLEAGTMLQGIVGAEEVRVNSFHHQALADVAEGFVVSARAVDGVIEGIEDPARAFCLGVQWHPERRSDDPLTLRLFGGLVEAARSARGRQGACDPRPGGVQPGWR